MPGGRRALVALVAVVLVLVTSTCSGRSELVGRWAWESVSVDSMVHLLDSRLSSSEIPGAPGWVSFESDGSLVGEGPCNSFEGRYRVEGTQLVIEGVRMTAGACVGPEGGDWIMKAEALLTEPLLDGGRVDWHIDDDVLVLEIGSETLTFTRADGY